MPARPSGHLALGSPPFELKSPDEYPLLTRDDQPKPEAAVAVGGHVAGAVRRPAIPAEAATAAPTKHPFRPRSRTRRIRLRISIIIAKPIAAPLKYIPVHIKQTPSVGGITAYRLSSLYIGTFNAI
jgi:hypothetical protein